MDASLDAIFDLEFENKILMPTATIIGGPDLHVDKGSTINLTCAVKYSPEPPAYIFWYHHDEVISYDSSRGGVSVITEKGDVTTSHLLIQNADLDDSGKYSCSPSNADVASVRVHVLNGEHPEAMQTGGGTAVVPYDVRLLLLLAALLALILPAISPSCTAEGTVVSVCPEDGDRWQPHPPAERNSSTRNPTENYSSTSRNRHLDGSHGDGGRVASSSSTIDRHRSVRCDSVR
uniref:Ig-like domain-containing protein n=1 Tax=Anopheles farauti TaxID=69004 RepID=A0A182QIF8_9DIPT